MNAIVVATADEDLRRETLAALAAEGRAAATCAAWSDAVSLAAHATTKLVLVDGELPGASGPLLVALAQSLPHRPLLRVLRGELPPIEPLVSTGQLARFAGELSEPVLTRDEQRLVELLGIGPDPLVLLQQLARSPMPVRVQGERGTGKRLIAQLVHRLADDRRPFVVRQPTDEPAVRSGEPGTLYLENLEQHPPEAVLNTLALAEATGWRVMAGSRDAPSPRREGMAWTHVHVRPLRERPQDVRPLFRAYLDRYRQRLGLPTRRVGARLWDLVERYPWPGNHRELETFVVQAATSARGSTISVETLPKRVLAMLDASERDRGERRAFEELVEARLRPVVQHYAPSTAGPTLYGLVIDATERALLRVALGHVAGNQKKAAELLGIARNTLRERVARLDPFNEEA